jgi:beta-galactosidase
LYQAHTVLSAQDRILDDQSTPFGIRDVRWEPATGFWLNGRNVKIKGLCVHQDCGALGAAVPLQAWQRRFAILKQIGCNAIRTSHNPPAPEFLDLADRMGLLVMHEVFDTWTIPKRAFDGSRFFEEWWERDLADSVLRDRNHPSIIIYSAGNEIPDLFDPAAHSLDRFKRILEVYRKNDPTRPVTLAGATPGLSGVFTNGLADMQDVVGQNYSDDALVAQHQRHPEWKILSTEDFCTRKAWCSVRDSAALAGQFVWCAFDYLGESFGWPEITYDYGIFDRIGLPTALALEQESYWSEKPVVQLLRQEKNMRPNKGVTGSMGRFADWTPHYPDYKTAKVLIFGNCQEVEVLLNGKSLGVRPFLPDCSPVKMEFPFEPGSITVLGRNAGKVAVSRQLRTAGKASAIQLAPFFASVAPGSDRANSVLVSVVDSQGVQVPTADHLISFAVDGPGTLLATDSADMASHDSFQSASRRAFDGHCLVIVKATAGSGEITLSASAPGLATTKITLPIRAPAR